MVTDPTAKRVLGPWLEDLASDAPTPGGGPAAAVVGAAGAALISMVGRLTVGRERFADVEEQMGDIIARADEGRARFLDLADRDVEAFEGFMEALRLPRETDEERSTRSAAVHEASVRAADIPMEIARRAVDLMEPATEVAASGNPQAASDGACAAACLHAAAHAALASVQINAASMSDARTSSRYIDDALDLRGRADRLLAEAHQAFTARLPS